MGSWERFKNSFISTYVNDEEIQHFYLTRYSYGSLMAFGLAAYNMVGLRQKILKHAIHFTKSTNPSVVKTASVFIGLAYYIGLVAVWHIPSIGAESSVRCYIATENAVTNALISGEEIYQRTMTGEVAKNVLLSNGIKPLDK